MQFSHCPILEISKMSKDARYLAFKRIYLILKLYDTLPYLL